MEILRRGLYDGDNAEGYTMEVLRWGLYDGDTAQRAI
jgi:hypothetical protein